MLSAPPLPWYCQTPVKSRFGAACEDADFAAGRLDTHFLDRFATVLAG